jgi:hypothetical protein
VFFSFLFVPFAHLFLQNGTFPARPFFYMPYQILIGWRESCPFCKALRNRKESIEMVAEMTGSQLSWVGESEIPPEVAKRFPGVPVIMFTDADGKVLVDKTLHGLRHNDDVPSMQLFARELARWTLALRGNNI